MTITPFVEDQFPPNISAGAKGGPGFNTTVVRLSSGFEQRNINWSRELPTWDISTGIKDIADFRAYQKFFYARRGKAVGFRFKDHSDYKLPFWRATPGDLDAVPTLFITDGTTATFQIYKVYTTGVGDAFARKITKIVTASYNFYDITASAVALVDTSDYTIDKNTGIVTLSNAIKATTAHNIIGYCQFDVPARFDTDTLNAGVNGNELFVWDSIPVVGLKL